MKLGKPLTLELEADELMTLAYHIVGADTVRDQIDAKVVNASVTSDALARVRVKISGLLPRCRPGAAVKDKEHIWRMLHGSASSPKV